MQSFLDLTHAAVSGAGDKRTLASFDSGEEFSFYHWIAVCQLVDEGDVPLEDEGLPLCEEIEEALEETISEMESAAADQNFASHVI